MNTPKMKRQLNKCIIECIDLIVSRIRAFRKYFANFGCMPLARFEIPTLMSLKNCLEEIFFCSKNYGNVCIIYFLRFLFSIYSN